MVSKRTLLSDKSVFIGCHNMANMIPILGEIFSKIGIEQVRIRDIYPNPLYNSKKEWWHKWRFFKSLRIRNFALRITRLECFLQALRSDVIILTWRTSFLPRFLDYSLYSLLKKEVIIICCGSDVRFRPIQNCLEERVGVRWWASKKARLDYESIDSTISLLKEKLSFQKAIEKKNKFTILNLPSQSTFARKRYSFFRLFYSNNDNLTDLTQENERVVILHAASNEIVKQTSNVLEALGVLKKSGAHFEQIVLIKTDHNVVLRALKKADIVIDQIGHWPAQFAIEAMQNACVVFTGYNPEFVQAPFRLNSILKRPLSSTELANELFELINDRKRLKNLQANAVKEFDEYFSIQAGINYWSQILTGNSVNDVVPFPDELVKECTATEWAKEVKKYYEQ